MLLQTINATVVELILHALYVCTWSVLVYWWNVLWLVPVSCCYATANCISCNFNSCELVNVCNAFLYTSSVVRCSDQNIGGSILTYPQSWLILPQTWRSFAVHKICLPSTVMARISRWGRYWVTTNQSPVNSDNNVALILCLHFFAEIVLCFYARQQELL